MTLRTIESEFSNQLLQEMKEETSSDLRMDGPIITKAHPKLIWARLQFENNPEQDPLALVIPGWNYDCFAESHEAEKAYPQIKMKFEGRPWALAKFLQGQAMEAIIDFGPMGTTVISKNELNPTPEKKLHWHLLPLWLSYALSPELWGAQGKWTRFHTRLHDLLDQHKLLVSEDSTAYYPLKVEARKLEAFGFLGSSLEKSYILVLPWTFSLTDMVKLEKCIQQEF